MDDLDMIENVIDFCNIDLRNNYDANNIIIETNYKSIIDTIISLNNKYKLGDDYKLTTNTLKMVQTMTYLYRYVSNWFSTAPPTIIRNPNFVVPTDTKTQRGGSNEEYIIMINNYNNVQFQLLENNIPDLYIKPTDNDKTTNMVDVNYGFYMDTTDILDYLYKLSLYEDTDENIHNMDVVGGANEIDKFEKLYELLSENNKEGFTYFVRLLKQILQIPGGADMYNVEQIIDITADESNKILNVTYSTPLSSVQSVENEYSPSVFSFGEKNKQSVKLHVPHIVGDDSDDDDIG